MRRIAEPAAGEDPGTGAARTHPGEAARQSEPGVGERRLDGGGRVPAGRGEPLRQRGRVVAREPALDAAGAVPGRKVVIVFSNGPDNASMVAPDDVRAVAEDEGIPIYVISTSEVTKDPVSSNVFKRISTGTGGKSYFARTWQKQVEAFEAIREDLGNSYTVTYYPQPNPNEGFRKISVEVTTDAGKKYRVQARPGYRPQRGF